MRLNIESTDARQAKQGKWHSWFAWHPVRVGEDDVRWLERVSRRGGWVPYTGWVWEYLSAFAGDCGKPNVKPEDLSV
ncbi:hypothetical protein EXN69_26255 [Rhizobium rhizogenes]|nr:hypothetical protein FFE80_07370 [Rhizobium rhizogenes]TRB51502.1 hypothetical protein EXN69_26255 [Rhizobium rhizogenes]